MKPNKLPIGFIFVSIFCAGLYSLAAIFSFFTEDRIVKDMAMTATLIFMAYAVGVLIFDEVKKWFSRPK